jgi:hypothetical protein
MRSPSAHSPTPVNCGARAWPIAANRDSALRTVPFRIIRSRPACRPQVSNSLAPFLSLPTYRDKCWR